MSLVRGFPDDSAGKESTYRGDIGDVGSITGSGKSPQWNGNPLQYSCLENPMDRGIWWVIVQKVSELDMTECQSTHIRL